MVPANSCTPTSSEKSALRGSAGRCGGGSGTAGGSAGGSGINDGSGGGGNWGCSVGRVGGGGGSVYSGGRVVPEEKTGIRVTGARGVAVGRRKAVRSVFPETELRLRRPALARYCCTLDPTKFMDLASCGRGYVVVALAVRHWR